MVLAVVQSAATGSNQGAPNAMSVVFGSAPTNGNLLYAMVSSIIVSPVVGAGWTLDSSSSFTNWAAQTVFMFHIYKYAGAGESTTQTPNSANIGFGAVQVWEISGVSGTFATDHVANKDATTGQGTNNVSSWTFGTDTTTNNSELGLFFGSAQNSGSFGAGPLSVSGGSPTTDNANANGASGFDGIGFHQAFPTLGTVTPAYTISFSSANCTGYWALTRLKGTSASVETGAVTLALSKVSFSAIVAHTETATTSLALSKVSFSASGRVGHTGAVTFVLNKISFLISSFNLSVLAKLRQFATFN